MEMMPGMNQMLPLLKGQDGNQKLKNMINILDSMTDTGSIRSVAFNFLLSPSLFPLFPPYFPFTISLPLFL
jgi:hypothetical protein